MDSDLIKVVNRVQDCFANLGECTLSDASSCAGNSVIARAGGELDMPQLVVVRGILPVLYSSSLSEF
jgi:hypothetical protein